MNRKPILQCLACVVLPLALIPRVSAQEKTPTPEAPKPANPSEVVELSPFVVTSDEDNGYAAQYTLAGTRLRTDLKDVGSSISVITAKFMADTGSTNATQLLVYTPNTEVVGQGGNFLGIGDDQYSGAVKYGTNRVRGLSNADSTRDFFLTNIPWDSYNTGRIDIQRGPNSILFGIGSPAGIINASLNHAGFKNSYKVENKVDNFGTVRFSGDFNQVLVDNQLAVRISLLDDDTKFRQQPAFRHDQRFFGSLRYDPAFLNKGSMKSTFEASFEQGDIESNLPRQSPPIDFLTPWFHDLAGFQAGQGVTWRNGAAIASATNPAGFWLNNAADQVTQGGTVLSYNQTQPSGVNYPENVASNVPWVGQAFLVGIGSKGKVTNDKGVLLGIPGASIQAWKATTINDRSIFDSYDNLLDGDTKHEFNKFTALNLAFRQSFLDDTLGYELAFDQQKTHQGGHNYLGTIGYGIGIDVMTTLPGGIVGGSANPAGGTFAEVPDPVNPNFGRPYVVGGRGSGSNWSDDTKTSSRFTGYYDLDLKKHLGADSMVARIFGRNVFTGLFSSYEDESASAGSPEYYTDPASSVSTQLGNNPVYIFNYLSPKQYTAAANGGNLFTDPSNLHLGPLTGVPNVGLQQTRLLFDATAKTYSTVPFSLITNWDKPEADRAYSSASKEKRTVNTGAVVWQGYWFDGVVVPMAAYRKDQSYFNEGGTYNADGTFNANAPQLSTVNGNRYFPYDESYVLGPKGATSSVTSRTYSIVTHTPKKWQDKLPGHTDLQLIYNQSENFKPEPGRVDIYDRAIPDPSGRTKEYGIGITTLHDKVYLKVVHYETHEDNADLSNLANIGALAGMEVWARSAAYVHAGKAVGGVGPASGQFQADRIYGYSSDGHPVTFKPYGPWAANAAVIGGQPGSTAGGPITQWEGITPNEPAPVGTTRSNYTQADIDATWAIEKASIDAVINNPPPDSFIDATKINRATFFGPNGPGMFDYDSGGGSANAVVTGSTVSKGTEFELVANPIAGLSISLNASHTEASRTSIAQSYLDYLTSRRPFFYGAAGDMRIWSSGEADLQVDPYTTNSNASMSVAFRSQVDAPLSLFTASEGTMVPELKPWAFNVVANYAFQSTGWLKGWQVGGGYRWQDKNIVGYPITHDEFGNEEYDVKNPYYGPTEAAVDLWVGYQRKLTRRLQWHVQLNVRNAFANDKLILSSVNPDGTGAAYRIPEPRTFTLTNTIEF